jgi:phosphate:Na+ symporter
MSVPSLLGGLAGGVGLFLLGMWLMTDGLKLAAGSTLERILARSTSTPLRGLASGILITALVQSSSAVTVTTIGFVNAGLLTLGQALWVLFGSNVDTTMTGWLVSLVGLNFRIEALALPMIGLGMVLHFTGERRRRGALGMALAGFGVLFLGIGVLKDTFMDLGGQMTLPGGIGVLGVLAHVGAGALLTVLMQSSSAALAVALTAAQGGLLGIDDAAAVVIGANIGTTATALLAALGATPNARRAAAAHVLFNLLTGTVALLLLPWLIDAVGLVRDLLELDAAPAVTLALFHTVFNVLGVLLMWPLAGRLTEFLARRFRTAEEDEARPQHLDSNVLSVPALALDALIQEVRRMGEIALRGARRVWAIQQTAAPTSLPEQAVVAQLNEAIARFIAQLHRVSMAAESAQRLPEVLRAARYYDAVVELSADLMAMPYPGTLGSPQLRDRIMAFMEQAEALLGPDAGEGAVEPDSRLADLQRHYRALKAELLAEGARGDFDIHDMELCLRRLSRMRRLAEQALKAAITLQGLTFLPIGPSCKATPLSLPLPDTINMLPERFRRFLPDPKTLREHPALRWLGPWLHHPRLWHVNRRGIALGLAIGVFFGLLIPVAQILFAAVAALLLRANIPAAVGSTLITNPITFAPVYYAAYHLGAWMLGTANVPVAEADLGNVAAKTSTGLALWMDRLATVGAPLAVGLLTLAVSLSVLIYFAVHWTWRLRIVRAWQRRKGHRRPR